LMRSDRPNESDSKLEIQRRDIRDDDDLPLDDCMGARSGG